jgi:hypothetical protein
LVSNITPFYAVRWPFNLSSKMSNCTSIGLPPALQAASDSRRIGKNSLINGFTGFTDTDGVETDGSCQGKTAARANS